MPRVSLPSSLKNLKTYEVLLTQTTESDIRLHCETFFANFEAKNEKYKSRITDVVCIFLDSNPYRERDWKKHIPTRHHKESFLWFGNDEVELNEYFKFREFQSDLICISKIYEWEILDDMKWELQKFAEFMLMSENDLKQLESMRFNQAKIQFEDENKDWIEEQKEIKKHKQNHHSGYGLRVKHEDGECIDKYLECKYCKKDYELEIEMITKAREYEARNKQVPSAIIQESSAIIQEEAYIPYKCPPLQECNDCGFKSHYKADFEFHKHESQHKKASQLKEWYCKDCEIQSQSKIKYLEHLESIKHKKNIGEIKNIEYFCEKCNYKTLLKHHYEQHIQTKKHIELL